MDIWKLRSGFTNDYTSLVSMDEENYDEEDVFLADGTPKSWPTPPQLEPFRQKSKKKQKPLADVNSTVPGSIILNPRAYAALKDFLAPFGQFLTVEIVNAEGLLSDSDKESETHYFYNVTNMIACVDLANSQKEESLITKLAFFPEATPKDAQIFKDPLRKLGDIFLSNPAKLQLEKLIAEGKITGIEIFET